MIVRSRFGIWVCILALVVVVADPATAEQWAFDFGAPGSVTRDGFVKVTSSAGLSGEVGHGFDSTEGLLDVDRSSAYWWKKQVHPTDERLGRVYGEYRSTSYTTCDFVEGTQDNAFIVNAPDGEYEVWAIVADPAEAPPFFEIRANGETKHHVRLGRRGFVFMEPFQARAEEGVLRIELAGSHGWLINALMIGTPDGTLAKTVGEMERDIFFDYAQHLEGWKRLDQPVSSAAPDLTADETARGYVVFTRDYTEKVYPFTHPQRDDIDRPLTAFATPGEFEPATAAIYAVGNLGAVDVSVSDFTSADGGLIPSEQVDVGIVRCWRQRAGTGRGPSGYFTVEPELIEPAEGRMRRVSGGVTKQWWFTVRVPRNADPGRYTARVTFSPENASPVEVEWRLLVLPFELARPNDRHWGTWLDSFPPLRRLRGPERRGRNTPEEVARLARLEMQDFRDHGFDVAILEVSGIKVTQEADGSFSYDISTLRQQMEYLKILGEQAVVPICFEYLCRRLEYRYADEPEAEHVPGTFSTTASRAIVGLVEFLEKERGRNGWPRFLYLPIDEPGNNKTENRMTFGRNVLGMVKSVPGARTGCTITARGVQQLGDLVDTRIYAHGHVSEESARRDADRGFLYWYYANGMLYGSSTIASRYSPGLELLRSGAECATGWGFAAYHHNPYNDFDGRHRDWNVLLPGPDGPIPTIYWELCREGVDDCRYVATIRDALDRTDDETAVRRAQTVIEQLVDPDATPIDEPIAFHRYRWRLAREILNLRGTDDLTPQLAFTPVAEASQRDEKLEPNIIENPSFEDGPQEDGLPGWPYPYDDPYTEGGKKPAGAIMVTDEIAYDGQYSLRWDFAKSEGAGAQYGGNRYLIINVQVADEIIPEVVGRRVRTGMWVRTGGGTLAPGFNLRMFATRDGEYTYLDGISYRGGLEDPAVWNRYEAEGVILPETESIDIHISCKIPDDPAVRDESVFYIDAVSIRPITPVPVSIQTALDELYIGESVRWTAATAKDTESLTVSLLRGDKVLQTVEVGDPDLEERGEFTTDGLEPGVYRLSAEIAGEDGINEAWQEIIVAPDPFDW